jgi:hypothetical protein
LVTPTVVEAAAVMMALLLLLILVVRDAVSWIVMLGVGG